MIQLEIPGDSNELGPNKKRPWQARNRILQEWRTKASLTARSALNQSVIRPARGPVRASFVIRRGRRLDPDNAASSLALKGIIDGFRDAGLIKDDTAKYCERGSVRQEISKEYAGIPSVVVVLEEL